jgi:hypothetical protein
MLANCINLGVPRKGTTLTDVDANDVKTPVIGSASKTMHAFEHTDSLDLSLLLCVRKPWLACDITFQSRGIPDLHSLVV